MTQRSEPRRIRRRWLILGLLLLAMVLAIGWHRLWTIGATRRLAKQVATYRAAGQPIELEDFLVLGVARADNAVPELRAAAAAIDRTTDIWTKLRDRRNEDGLPLRTDEVELFRAAVAGNPTVLPLVESAATKRGVDWGLVFTTPVINLMLPDLQRQRELANLIKIDALLAHTDGDHSRALRRVGELLFLARAIGRQPILVSHLVSIGVGAMASELVATMAEDLRIGNAPGEATPQQVRSLIATLLDDTDAAASQRAGLLGERMMQLDVVRAVADGKMGLGFQPNAKPSGAMAALIKPTALDDGVLMLRHTTGVLEASGSSVNWPEFQRVAPKLPDAVHERPWRHSVARTYTPSFDRAVQTRYHALTDRRMAAVVLALRLYATEHGGKLPETLDLLVPNYLPAIPLDPMAAGLPLQFVPGPDPIVYSVGEDGVDDGGSEQSKSTRMAPHKWDRLDAVVHFKRQPRPAPEELDDGVGGFSAGLEPSSSPTTEPVSP